MFKNIRAGRKAHFYFITTSDSPSFFCRLRLHRFAKAFGIRYENGATFRESILEGEERVKHCLGYKVLEELRIKDHFYHIDFDFKPDNRLYCIGCHGDMPHSNVKEIRAFAEYRTYKKGPEFIHIFIVKRPISFSSQTNQ